MQSVLNFIVFYKDGELCLQGARQVTKIREAVRLVGTVVPENTAIHNLEWKHNTLLLIFKDHL